MSERLVLRCAISQARLTDPAKGQGCGHAAQCNYAVLCDHINLTRACPVCHVHVRREREVVRDDALRVGLSQLPAEARAAWLRSVGDGRWLRPEAVDGTRIQVTGLNLELNGCKGKIVRQSEEGLYEVRLDPAVGNDPKGARAVMGLRASAPLPEGWKECVDKSTGDSYYYNASTSTTTWERPAASGRASSSTEVQIPTHKSSHSSVEDDESEDESGDEGGAASKRKLPSWANPKELMSQLQQQDNPTQGDDVFGQQIHLMEEACALKEIFGSEVTNKRHHRRGSSGCWDLDRLTEQEEQAYQKSHNE
jgi:hypothetical protein